MRGGEGEAPRKPHVKAGERSEGRSEGRGGAPAKSWGTKSAAGGEKRPYAPKGKPAGGGGDRPFAAKKPAAPKVDARDTSKRFVPPKKPRT